MQIEIEVTGQKIKRLNSPGSVADTFNYLTCHFIFMGEEWDNTVRTAYFEKQKSGERYAQIIADDGTCTVPWEALTDNGFVRFSVAGEREDYRITTDVESFYNSDTIYGGNPSEPPTPDQYDQMIALAEQTKEIAESVRRDADEGKFDGDPGEPGEPGAPGRDGVSPTAKVEQTDDGAVITITDAAGTTAAELKNGKEGKPGQNATDEQVRGAVDAYMAEHPVQVDTDDLIKIAIKEEASGAVPIVTTDSAEMGVQDLTMQGWTEQESTTGANLIDYTQAIPRNKNQSVEIIDGGVKWTGDYYFIISVTGLEKNQTYTMHYVSDDASAWMFGYTDGTYSSQRLNGGAGTTDPEKDCDKVFIYKSNPTVSGQDMVFTNIMLNEGSTALPYEPYTGGQPSPSPDYPQEIVSAGKYNEDTQKWEYEAEVGCGQLLNFQENNVTLYGITCESKIDTITINGTKTNGDGGRLFYKTNDFVLQPGTYTFSYEVVNDINSTISGIFLTKKDSNEILGRTFTLNESTEVYIGTNIYGARQANDVVVRCMLNTGSTPLPYTPYRPPQTVLITSDRPLTRWDKLEKRNGQWGWVYKSDYIVLDGSENWGVYAAYEGFSVGPIFDTPRLRSEGFSERFVCETGSTNLGKYTLLWLGVNNHNIYFVRVPQYNAELSDSGLQDWKDYLAENPLTILTYADEETFAPLSESEQSALNALTTYYPTTVLDNDQGCEMSVQYIADTKAYIDKKISAIQAAIVNTI